MYDILSLILICIYSEKIVTHVRVLHIQMNTSEDRNFERS